MGRGRLSEVGRDLHWMNEAYLFSAQPKNLAEGMGCPDMVLTLVFNLQEMSDGGTPGTWTHCRSLDS